MADSPTLRSRLPAIALGIVLLIVVVAGILFVIKSLKGKGNKPARQVQVVQVVRPPPPPPPPESQPPPPPPEKTEKFEQSEPDPTPQDSPAPAENLALDAAGAAGGDAFGLAARPGGRDMIGGGGTAPFGGYQSRLSSQLNEKLSGDSRLKAKKFTVSVRLWIEPDGRIREVLVTNSTGDQALDAAIQSSIASLQRLPEPPPLEMPQPVTLRITRKI